MISLPSKKKTDGTWEDIVQFVSRDARLAAEAAVGAFLNEGKESQSEPRSSPPRDKPAQNVSVNTSGVSANAGLPRRPF